MDRASPSFLRTLADAAVNGLRLLAVGLAALVLAIVAAVTTIVGVAAKVVAEVLAQVAGFVRDALPFLLSRLQFGARRRWRNGFAVCLRRPNHGFQRTGRAARCEYHGVTARR